MFGKPLGYNDHRTHPVRARLRLCGRRRILRHISPSIFTNRSCSIPTLRDNRGSHRDDAALETGIAPTNAAMIMCAAVIGKKVRRLLSTLCHSAMSCPSTLRPSRSR